MNIRDARATYQARLHRVLEHIDRHLDQPLDLAQLAEVAHFSPFHFHRLFAAWAGERLGDYLRRRRLEQAALRLIAQPRSPVLDIALAVGFGSAEAFARAFKQRFGCSPSAWRVLREDMRKHGQADRKMDQVPGGGAADDRASHPPTEDIAMNVQLITRPDVTIAYLRHVGPYGDAVAAFWGNTVVPFLVTNGLMAQPRYGIGHDDPSITDPAQCRYDAGAEVAPDVTLAGPALKTVIPGGRYATLPFEGTVDEIGAAWASLMRDWLPASGLQLDARPCFEYYRPNSRYDPATGVFDCEICIPVVPL